jgi:hypothetical protein
MDINSQNLQENAAQTTPVTSSSTTSKKKLPIILGGILLISGGTYIFSQQKTIFSPPTPIQNSASALPTITSGQTNSIVYTSRELPIGFSYPSELGRPEESSSSPEIKEKRWSIYFIDDEPNYATGSGEYTFTANSLNYAPGTFENPQVWINAEITKTDTAATVKQKLLDSNYQVLDVEKVQNITGLTAFRVWLLHCYFTGCLLARDYVIPFNYNGYMNVQIYGRIKNLNAAGDPLDKSDKSVETARKLAERELAKIKANDIDADTKKYIDIHDSLFNTLVIDSKITNKSQAETQNKF